MPKQVLVLLMASSLSVPLLAAEPAAEAGGQAVPTAPVAAQGATAPGPAEKGVAAEATAAQSKSVAENVDAIRQSLAEAAPSLKVDSVEPSPVAGLYEVVIGPKMVYITEDGRYLVSGDVVDLTTGINITEAKRDVVRKQAIDAVDVDEMIVFAPENPKHTVTVFTDIDCGYCRKLHREIKQYEDAGIAVRYLLYPRTGINSESYYKAVSTYCADDRKKTLTEAKQGKTPPKKSCPNPVKDNMALGKELGVTGTPTIVLEDGHVVPGYVPAKSLALMLDQRAK